MWHIVCKTNDATKQRPPSYQEYAVLLVVTAIRTSKRAAAYDWPKEWIRLRTMRTYNDIESPQRRKLHVAIGLGVIGVIYTLVVALIRVYLL
jgi:hypothetical protein